MADSKKPKEEQGNTSVLDGQYGLFEDLSDNQVKAALLINDIAPDLQQPAGTTADNIGAQINGLADAFESSVKDIDAEQVIAQFKELEQRGGAQPGTAEERFKKAHETLLQYIDVLRDFIQSPEFKRLASTFPDFEDCISGESPYVSITDLVFFANDDLKKLLPAVLDEVDKLKQQPGMKDLTLREFLRNTDENGNKIESYLYKTIDNIERKLESGQLTKQEPQNIPKIKSLFAQSVEYPLDKINSNVWDFFENTQANGQLAFATERSGSPKEATVLYGIDFDALEDELHITKKLTPFDKRVYLACSELYNLYAPQNTAQQGKLNQPLCFSVSQIYSTMGNTGRPSAKAAEKINASLTKMQLAMIHIDSSIENSVYKNYVLFKYDGYLLPFERMSAYIDGQFSDSLIHPFREPPLVSFAKSRNQITTLPINLLCSPVNKTDENLRIDDYLIARIAHMKNGKNGKISKKILFSKIYEKCGISEKKQKQRAPEKIRRYLDHYVKCAFIQGYTESKDGITILI